MRLDRGGKSYLIGQNDWVSLRNHLLDIGRRLDRAEGIGQSPDYKGKRLANVGAPTQAGDAVNLETVQALIAGLSVSESDSTSTVQDISDPDDLLEKELVSTDYLVIVENGVYKKARADQLILSSGFLGIIAMWSGFLADIPDGWSLCDGTGGTPDLREKFVMGWSDSVDPGGTGGTLNHKHSTTVPAHDHTVDVGTTTSGAPSGTTIVQSGAGTTVASDIHTHDTDPAQVTSSATIGTAVDSDTVSHIPPYYQLAFLMKV